ncbi:MAG: bifunctional precorrin-2 dehydrogenase/sirohydrochlorin ferrochelatase [Magnetococcales bacterium]|nr:bifunctional precorrin-2 dehydrogenase/sirohydrochlorin ferrochelatase [Magnetococcales bacterium]MBF0114361.1 bifunctional precorrin-2 dehydrogenase/sirohydrochlorin ferrochelatase [Magnetococcales bacterium]
MSDVLFPLFLQLTGRPCLVIGGGRVAMEKATRLLEFGAVLTIVAPQLVAQLQQRVAQHEATWIPELFQEEHLQGMWFVVSTLRDPEINQRILAEANRRCIFLNVVDQPAFCSSHWPAILSRPPVTVAFSTAGTAPALAGYLRRTLNEALPPRLDELATWLAYWRKQVQPILPELEARGEFWRHLFALGIVEKFAGGEQEQAEELIRRALQTLENARQEQTHD